jgi:L-malate glycosyltransferase
VVGCSKKINDHDRQDARECPRILLVAPSLDILGGQAIQASHLLSRLATDDAIRISFLPINPRLPSILSKLQRIKYLRTIVTSVLYIALLLLRVPRYDVIHVFSASYFSFVLAPTPAILISKLFRKKVVLNYHSGEAEDHLNRWRRTAIPTLELADVIVVPSGYLVDVFARFGLRAFSIPNIVDMYRFAFRKRNPLHPVFLTNRNFEPHYNVGCALRAYAIIQQRFPEASLVVAGDGKQRRQLQKLSQTLGLRRVDFVGKVAPQEMPQLYDAADIYLNCSEIDNMPGSIIEAFASGLPIVTSDAGGIPYMVENEKSGLIVPAGNHRAVAAAAIRLLESPDFAAEMAENALQESRKYQWEAVRDQWVSLYLKLACLRKDGLPIM